MADDVQANDANDAGALARAVLRRVRISPKKLRSVARELTRGRKHNRGLGLRYDKAMAYLDHHPTKAAEMVRKTLKSAFSNLQYQNRQVTEDEVYVYTSQVDPAFTIKRIQARARGRADRIDKRNSHLTIVVKAVS